MKQRAFTLIELLVVIAIIGILATVVLTSLGSARERARDARRQSDIRTIQQALEVYYLEHGQYPSSNPGTNIAPSNGWSNSAEGTWALLEAEMGVDLPEDPINTPVSASTDWAGGANKAFNYVYYSRAYVGCPAGQLYMLVYRFEEGDAVGSERGGIIKCGDGNLKRYGNGSITVGVTPAG